MKAFLIILGSLVIIGLIAFFFFLLKSPSQQSPSTIPTNPVFNQPPSQQPQNVSVGPTIQVAAINGGTITVRDFTKLPTTAFSSNLPGHYYIAGGLDPSGTDAEYSTFYVDTDQSFNVSLLKEPLAQARMDAENDLMQKLGIDKNSMCRLRYYIGVPNFVNAIYSGKNLGWSFCPGVTQL